MIINNASIPSLVTDYSTIEVYRIGALLQGPMSDDQILKDYPSLKQMDLDEVRQYIKDFPLDNNPYPDITFKEGLRRSEFYLLED